MEKAIQKSWQKCAQKLLNQVWKIKSAYYFYDPVDPVKFKIEDYFDVIGNPMDLNTIKKNLSFNLYENFNDFV